MKVVGQFDDELRLVFETRCNPLWGIFVALEP
jgi:hypothetical protein